jgi:hypothetical protein
VVARGLGNLVADGNTEIHGSKYRAFRGLAGGVDRGTDWRMPGVQDQRQAASVGG